MSSIRVKQSLRGKLNNAILHEYPELEDLEVMPSMKEQHFKSDVYGYNEVIVNGEPNLVPENIPEGISMFGVDGTKEILNTSDATATANDIIAPKTAYVNGEKLIGNIELETEVKYFGVEVYNLGDLTTQLVAKRDNCLVAYNYTNQAIDVYKIDNHDEKNNLQLMDSYDVSNMCSMTEKWNMQALDIGIEDTEGNRYGVLIKKDVSSTSNFAIVFKINNYKIVNLKELNIGNLTSEFTIYACMTTFANIHSNLFVLYLASSSTNKNNGTIVCAEIDSNLNIYNYGIGGIGRSDMNGCGYLNKFRCVKFESNDKGFVVMGSANSYRVQSLYKINYDNNHLSSLTSIHGYCYRGTEPIMYNDNFSYSISTTGLFKNVINWDNNSFTEKLEQIATLDINYVPLWFYKNLVVLHDTSTNTLKSYNFNETTDVLTFISELSVNYENSTSYCNYMKINFDSLIYYYSIAQIIQAANEQVEIINIKAYGNIYYNTKDSNILESDVAKGKVAYGPNGRIIGTLE